MNKPFLFSILFGMSWLTAMATEQPIGFAACTSMTDATPYTVNGGAGGRCITLRSNGGDMQQTIMDAVHDYDIITFDGSQGEFVVSSTMHIEGLSHKTLQGINHATIRTQLQFTEDIHHLLDSIDARNINTISDGKTVYTLSNGARVKEECEASVRQLLIDYLQDPEEQYRECGLFSLSGIEDWIIRDLHLVGPGAIDISGDDLLTLQHHSRHIWIDHVDFLDGVDGNFDINGHSDLITISWCHFHYSNHSYIHQNTNLIGSSDRESSNGEDALNVTFAFCHWGKGCNQRMPMARFGTIHLLNCYYDCEHNAGCINPRRNSEFLIEGCYFEPCVDVIFRASDDAKAYTWHDCILPRNEHYDDRGDVHVPYSYTLYPAREVPSWWQ